MTRATRPFDEEVFNLVLAKISAGMSQTLACELCEVRAADFGDWCFQSGNRRMRRNIALTDGKELRAAKAQARRDAAKNEDRRTSEHKVLRELESQPPPAGKEHYYVLGPSGRRSCAHCGARAPLPSLKFSEGRCAPVGGVYYGARQPVVRRSSAR